jgi:hypothetical protein
MADDHHPLEAERADELGHGVGLLPEAGRGAGGAGRPARTGAVDEDDAIIRFEILDERRGEIAHLAAQAVDQDHRRAVAAAAIDIVDAVAADVDERAVGRHGGLGLAPCAAVEGGEAAHSGRGHGSGDDDWDHG